MFIFYLREQLKEPPLQVRNTEVSVIGIRYISGRRGNVCSAGLLNAMRSHFWTFCCFTLTRKATMMGSLSDLFNKSLITGTLPTAWKFARVVPIPKSGSSKDSANYRPISILTVISKLLEKHIHNLLLLYLNSVSPLSQHQWGFSAGRSTTTALLSFTHNCQAALTLVTRSALYSLSYAKPSIKSLTCYFCKNLQIYR